MIGQFAFSIDPSADDVVLQLEWDGTVSTGKVVAPTWVIDALIEDSINVRSDDHYLVLPIALSYAVLVSAMSGARLTLSGDCSAWPNDWGILRDRVWSDALAISH